MNRFESALLLAAVFTLPIAACHNTAQGVKADARRALDKTGRALQKAGDKIDGHPKNDR
jgi:predicted small secreted protein